MNGLNRPPDCGQVFELGDVGGSWFESGYVKAVALSCRGDSGGPVWIPNWYWHSWQTDAIAAAGVIKGGPAGGTYDLNGYDCNDHLWFTDMGRALDITNSTFFVPGGDQASRRLAIRWYDIFSNRAPDQAGINSWSNVPCAGNAPEDIAFVFTVSGNNYYTEFEQRFPLTGSVAWGNSRNRVRALYEGMFDYSPNASEVSYWGGFIYGSSSSSSIDREARYDWLAWQFGINTSWPFQALKATGAVGINGSPFWCGWGI